MKIHHFSCADLRGLSIDGRALVCHVLVIETPSDGLVLVDTGLGRQDYADLPRSLGRAFACIYGCPRRAPSLAAFDQIQALGLRAADVRHIVLTHLDFDHAGGLPDFPDAKVHLHARELSAALDRRGFKARQRYRPSVWAHRPHIQTYGQGGDRWFNFEGARKLDGLSADILLVPLFGHTLGHCGVAIQKTDSWLFHVGDAYYDRRSISLCGDSPALAMQVFQAIANTDRRSRSRYQSRLRDLARSQPEIRIFSSHDPRELEAEQRRD